MSTLVPNRNNSCAYKIHLLFVSSEKFRKLQSWLLCNIDLSHPDNMAMKVTVTARHAGGFWQEEDEF